MSLLSRREKYIYHLLGQGITSNKEIAELLGVSEKTVKNHLTNLYKKLEVKNRTQAAVMAVKEGE